MLHLLSGMNQPRLYASNSGMQRRDSAAVLREFAPRLRWGRARLLGDAVEPEEASVLDIGCGSGDVTAWQLLPLLPARVRRVVAADISPAMVKHARESHRDPRLRFLQVDIGAADLTNSPLWQQEGHKGFSTIVSFYCFHWVQDQRLGLYNIWQLLRPGGEALLVFLAKCPVFIVYDVLANKPQWKPYMHDYTDYISPYQNVHDPAADFSCVAKEVGFHVADCLCLERNYTYDNMEYLTDSMMAVNPFIDRIPDKQKSQYVLDTVNEINKQKLVSIEEDNKKQRVTVRYSLLVAHLQKMGT